MLPLGPTNRLDEGPKDNKQIKELRPSLPLTLVKAYDLLFIEELLVKQKPKHYCIAG